VIHLAREQKRSLFIWGGIGIGKSYTVKQTAEEMAKEEGRKFYDFTKLTKEDIAEIENNPSKAFLYYDIRLSQFDPSDLRGLPSINGKETVDWKIPTWVKLFSLPNIAGMIFFDELNLAPPSIQASAYQIIHDRCISDTPISDKVVVIGAGNRTEDRGNVYELAKPLQNRFLHVELEIPSVDDWSKWAFENQDIDDRVVVFLQNRPAFLYKVSERAGDEAFPTPRSCEWWGKLIKDTEDLEEIERRTALAVGTEVASEFVAFLKLKKSINFQEILENPEKIKEIPDEEVHLKYALISLILDWYGKQRKDTKTLKKVLEMASNLQPKEFSILLLRGIRAKNPSSFMKHIVENKEFFEYAKREILPYL